MMRAGHEFAVSVPLLWRDVVVRDHIGVLAYRFAENTVPASHLATGNVSAALQRVLEVVRTFSRGETEWGMGQSTPREVVRRFGPANDKMNSAVAQLPPDVASSTRDYLTMRPVS